MSDSISKSELESRLKKFLKSSELKRKIRQGAKEETKSDKEMEKLVVDITKNVLTQLFKTMWTKRNFWKSDLKNKPN
jgi:hypothetical protein